MHIVIVDDDTKCLARTTQWLSKHQSITILFSAINGHDFLLKLQQHKQEPVVVIMDIGMRPLDGCTTSYYLKLAYPQIRIIAHTTYIDYEMIRNCFLCGVDGFVIKPFAEKELPIALDTVANGGHYLDSNLQHTINDALFRKIICNRDDFWLRLLEVEKAIKITKRERLFIALACTSLKYKEVGELLNIEEATAQLMYSKLAKKLQLRSIKDLTLYALQKGLAMQANFMFTNKNKMPY